VLWYDEVSSSNDVAAVLAERGAAEGLVVIVNTQSAGRGRHGRSWASPPGAGLYFSTILRPLAAAAPLVTIAAGVAVAEGVQSATGLECRVKWPNDVYVGDRKLAGVLAEADSVTHAINRVVLGIGINVMPAAYPPDVAARATSIEDQLGRAIDRGLLLAECLASMAMRYQDLQEGRADAVLDAWRTRAGSTLGRRVQWEAAGLERNGVAEDIDDAGALLVRTAAGVERIISGEVRWI
jgi:BirA family biotin operon repressor/biotin-[acetyl-CoA-carboxylase] ligase